MIDVVVQVVRFSITGGVVGYVPGHGRPPLNGHPAQLLVS